MKNSKDYVLNHDYGYGKEPEQEKLNKLKLRSVEDLRVYVDDVIVNAFVATYNNNIIEFKTENQKTKVEIVSLSENL